MKYHFSSAKICAGGTPNPSYDLNTICRKIVGDNSAIGVCEQISIYWTDHQGYNFGGSSTFTIGVCKVNGVIQKCVSAGRTDGHVIEYKYYTNFTPAGCAESSEIKKPT